MKSLVWHLPMDLSSARDVKNEEKRALIRRKIEKVVEKRMDRMGNLLGESRFNLGQASFEIGNAIYLLDYLHEDMESEIYEPAKEGNGNRIIYKRVEMMFALLKAARDKLETAMNYQSDLDSCLLAMQTKESPRNEQGQA